MRLPPLLRFSLIIPSICFCSHATALPFATSDARSAAMGGAGVASATGPTAGLSNPAMLARDTSTKFSFSVAGGAFGSDRDSTLDQIDAMQEPNGSLDIFANSIPNNFSTATPTQIQAYTSAAGKLAEDLTSVSGNFVRVGGKAGAALLFPLSQSKLALTATGQIYSSATPSITDQDLLALRALEDLNITNPNCSTNPTAIYCINGEEFSEGDITSSGDAVAIGITEVGLSFSAGSNRFSWGVTPKVQQIAGQQYSQRFNISSGFDTDILTNSTKEQTAANLDAGIAWAIDSNKHWVGGLTGHNLIKQDLTLEPVGNGGQALQEITIEPQFRAGIAYQQSRLTLAMDIDLTENNGISKQDTAEASQFIALGTEYRFTSVALRAGYRSNIADSNIDNIASIGLRYAIAQLAIAGNKDDVSGMLQLGFQI